jgi:hypothetical protein
LIGERSGRGIENGVDCCGDDGCNVVGECGGSIDLIGSEKVGVEIYKRELYKSV